LISVTNFSDTKLARPNRGRLCQSASFQQPAIQTKSDPSRSCLNSSPSAIRPFSALNSYFRVAGHPTRIHEFACRPLDERLGYLH
jgi:hypothetical protein